MSRRENIIIKFLLFLLLLSGAFLRLITGEVDIDFMQFNTIFTNGTTENLIVIHHRLPALLNAVFVGAGLSLAGYLMQVVFKNALAGPYILGVASGAGLFVAVFLLTGISCILATVGVSFMTIDKCKFRKPIIPGDVLNLHANRLKKVKNVYKFEGRCVVNDVIHAECIFSAMIHDIPNTSK